MQLSQEKRGRPFLPFSPVKVHVLLMNPKQTFLHDMACASRFGKPPATGMAKNSTLGVLRRFPVARPSRVKAAALGVLSSLSGDVVAGILPALIMLRLRDRLGGQLP